MGKSKSPSKPTFTKYQAFVIAILAIVQFSVVLDFMVLSPLGAQLMLELSIRPAQFGLVVSAYAFSAGIAGLLAAGFADKFDRKRLLLFFYFGFIMGTTLCAMAPNYKFLLFARVITGLFGGVMSSISFAIITDIFKMEVRGRVMGFVQMAFAASQVMGIPIGLWLANHYGWHSPFWMIVGFSIVVSIMVMIYLKPIKDHLEVKSDVRAMTHLFKTMRHKNYGRAFLATTVLATGGYMLMPFGSDFSIHNLGLTLEQLPVLYGVTGVFSIIFGPILGGFSDRIGKLRMFVLGSIISIVLVAIYTNLGVTPLGNVILLNVVLFVGISSRMISSSALITGIPEPKDRGAFMSINSAVQQFSGGIASACAGLIVFKTELGYLENYEILGFVVIVSMIIGMYLMHRVNENVKKQLLEFSKVELSPTEVSA